MAPDATTADTDMVAAQSYSGCRQSAEPWHQELSRRSSLQSARRAGGKDGSLAITSFFIAIPLLYAKSGASKVEILAKNIRITGPRLSPGCYSWAQWYCWLSLPKYLQPRLVAPQRRSTFISLILRGDSRCARAAPQAHKPRRDACSQGHGGDPAA